MLAPAIVICVLGISFAAFLVYHLYIVNKLQKQDTEEDRVYLAQLKEFAGQLKGAGLTIENLKTLVAAQQQGSLSLLGEIARLKNLINRIIDVSAHTFTDDPATCALCEAYKEFRTDLHQR